jgi:integrase
MPRGKKRDRDGIFERRDRPGTFYGSWIDAGGRRRKRKLDAYTLQQAREVLAGEKAKVEKARVLGYMPPGKETFAEILPRYLRHQNARLTPAAYERTRGVAEGHLKTAFGNVRLANIRRADVQRYATERSSQVAPGSVVKELNILKHVFNLAVEWELIPLNPMQRMKMPRVPAGRVRYLQPTELHAVIKACPEWLRPIAGLLAFTGMRRGEVLGLRWLDVDSKGGRVMLPQTKNGDGRVVWLNALACQVFDSIPKNDARPTDRVFPASDQVTPENVSLAFLRACRAAKIADFRLHDLRHTAASWLRMSGADLQDVAELLGHRDLRMTKRYSHLSPAHLSAAVKRLDAVFGNPPLLAENTSGEHSQENEQTGQSSSPIVPTASPAFHIARVGTA